MPDTTVALAHRERGDGTPLLLLHGFPHDSSLWDPQLASLASHARVLAPDLRGFGASRPGRDGATIDDYAADVKALLDSLGIRRAAVCGLSMGGYVALSFAAQFPHALGGLILVSTRTSADTTQARAAREAAAEKALAQGTGAVAEPMVAKMLAAETAARSPEVVQRVRAMMVRQPKEGVAAALRAMAARPDRSQALAAVTAPVLIVHGAADTIIPPAEAEAMSRLAPRSRLVLVPGAAHLPNLDRPDAFHAAVRAFVSALPSA